jgi:fermentation-respiration switch protein FrsA (DUF1100 family)
LFLFQRFLIYFPVKSIDFTPDQFGLRYKDIYFQTNDGLELNGWLIPAENSQGVILFCHGNAGNISHRHESIHFFLSLQLDVFIFDYRGFGRSKGTPDEAGTYLDGEAAWNYLIEKEAYSPEQIIIFGRSLGTGIASWLTLNKRPKAVILESSFTSLPDLGAKIYPLFPVRLLSRYKYPTSENLKHIDCPKLFIHSKDDEIIPYTLGFKNYQISTEPKQFLEIHGSHNDGFMVSGNIYEKGIRDFLSKYFIEDR